MAKLESSPIDTAPVGTGGSGIKDKEREALQKVTKFTFGVAPFKVKVHGTVTATWDVTIPPIEETFGFGIAIQLNGEAVAPTGSKTFKIDDNFSKTFRLTAVIDDDPQVGRILKSQQVIVDTSDCHDQSFPASAVTNPVKEQLDAAFSGSSDFKFRDPAKTQLTVGNAALDIRLPLSLNVPHWFDADMDVHVQLTIGGSRGVIVVAAPVVNASVDWSLLSDILSGGCTSAVAAGMTKLAQVFFEHIVDAEIRPGVKGLLEGLVNVATASAQGLDPQHRPYGMTTLIFSQTSGIAITSCPK